MEDINDIRRENGNRILTEVFGGKRTRMAAAIGVQQSYVSKILNKDAKGARNIGDDLARRIEEVSGKPRNWLDHKHGKVVDAIEDKSRIIDTTFEEVRALPRGRGRIPIISWVKAGGFSDIHDYFLPPGEYEYIDTSDDLRPEEAVCLRVENDSMWDPDNPRSFPPGCLIIVKRADLREPRSGDYVVVRLENESQATFKQLQVDGDRQYLKPLNKEYPTIEVTRPATFVGVVVEKILRDRY
ncbi:LexA family protein [Solimonas marina]|uniref:Peptidase S24/S26A/S26B/S26C domain-containing protein n=1 Tax=Solimonas marina TaxID=2714601 RepID=A0A969W8M4_9GAMM|nr:S24 family peptidase [Solimonas marina]NKF21550.1 hypothetical protein [Solimonas marina]